MRRDREHVRGCLLGGALGDALGAPVEFMGLAEIRSAFGAEGVRELQPAYGKIGATTDDTQMTLFTAEGLLRARVQNRMKGICHIPVIVHHAYIPAHAGRTFGASPVRGRDGRLALFPSRPP